MRANANLVIRGQRVLLVPYRREHVELYHSWMQDPVLQVRAGGSAVAHSLLAAVRLATASHAMPMARAAAGRWMH